MKKIFISLLLVFAVLGVASAQNASPQKTVKDFYAWYAKSGSQAAPQIKKYVSTRLINKVKKLQPKLDGDYYFKADGTFRPDRIVGITVSSVVAKSALAVVKVSIDGEDDYNFDLTVSLVKEKGVWKIYEVDGDGDGL